MIRPDNLPQRAYFVTLCAYQSQPLLGKLIDSQVELTESGRIISMCWSAIPEHLPGVQLDAFIIMPSHFHAILTLPDPGSQIPPELVRADPRALSTVLRSFKSAATRRVNHLNNTPGASLWQPSYHARVIDTQPALKAFRQYIHDNPATWQLDPLNPNGDRPAPFCPVPLSHANDL
jgi:putative transposase